MDTKDHNPDLTNPGVMSPDTTMGNFTIGYELDGTITRDANVTAPEELEIPPGEHQPKKTATPLQNHCGDYDAINVL